MLRGRDAAEDTTTPGHVTEIWTQAAVHVIQKATAHSADRERPIRQDVGKPQLAARAAGASQPVAPDRRALAAKRAAERVAPAPTAYYSVISEPDTGVGLLAGAVEKSGSGTGPPSSFFSESITIYLK